MDSKDVRRRWAERSGEFSPEYYAHRGPDKTSEAIGELLDRHLDRETPILEVGCSSGRHLAYLQESGFRSLAGIEVNAEAIAVMEETYPDLAAAATVHVEAIENVLGEFADDHFGAVYSVETLQHVHPDSEWIFAELARVTEELLVTVENEHWEGAAGETANDDGANGERATDDRNGQDDRGYDVDYVDEGVPIYYRSWGQVFADLGLIEIECQSGPRDTLRAFRPAAEREN
ncbi:class I SAM-dependent methyltransferase [Halobacteriales archaeon QS_3_64_16]|nr:MAG: class I SAM-dependent methyltransferase [Halobacteriales archaeon QS_3_64_16]